MTDQNLETFLRTQMRAIAPDIDIEDIDRQADLREEFDIDSMDFLNLVTAISKELKLEMPESDYARMASYDMLLEYLKEKIG
jgi:acyl carrier protein